MRTSEHEKNKNKKAQKNNLIEYLCYYDFIMIIFYNKNARKCFL
jgi:hypothetical protein